MKQEEKNKKSREHILSHAFTEFAMQGYVGASINSICKNGKISKGLLYHYYLDKDTLYLACVERCFNDITQHMTKKLNSKIIMPDEYFDVRLTFFKENPLHQRLFCDTVVNEPPHLKEKIAKCRASFDELNEKILISFLEKEKLQEGISIKNALYQLRIFEDFVNAYLKNSDREAINVEEHNELCRQTLHTMLYGLISRSL